MNDKPECAFPDNCPNPEGLSAFVEGKIDQREADTVAECLHDCETCQSHIEELESAADWPLAELQLPDADVPYEDETEYRQALGRLAAIGSRDGEPVAAEPGATVEDSPRTLREYQLLEKIGEGGMGAVFRALHTRLDRIVALKILPADRMRNRRAVERFNREMKAAGRVQHPNIVHATDAGEHEGIHYLVMEYVEGSDLSQLVRRCGPLPVADACEIIRQAALGLEAAREHGLVHRDIKPSNLMLDRGGHVKILDLGLALLEARAPDEPEFTASGQVMGTTEYMAPEQALSSHNVDIRADLYSLGCALYKLIAGRAPFLVAEYETPLAMMMAHHEKQPPSIREFVPDTPDELVAIIERLLEKAPADRYDTPAEVAVALAPLAEGSDLAALLTKTPAAEPQMPTATFIPTDEYLSSPHTDTDPSREAQHQPAAESHLTAPAIESTHVARRKRTPWIAAVALLLIGVIAIGAWQVIIRIQNRGKETTVKVPEGSEVTVDPDGNAVVKVPEGSDTKSDSIEGIKLPTRPQYTLLPNGWIVGDPQNLPGLVNTSRTEEYPRLSADGLTLYYSSRVGDDWETSDVWTATRVDKDTPFGKPSRLSGPVNTEAMEGLAFPAADGLSLWFNRRAESVIEGVEGGDLFVARRADVEDGFGKPENLGPTVNSGYKDMAPFVSPDGLRLLFMSSRLGRKERGDQYDWDIWQSTRDSRDEPFGKPIRFESPVNTQSGEGWPFLSSDGKSLLFSSTRGGSDPDWQLFLSTKNLSTGKFIEPYELPFPLNDGGRADGVALSSDGRTMLFSSDRSGGKGGMDIYQAEIILPDDPQYAELKNEVNDYTQQLTKLNAQAPKRWSEHRKALADEQTITALTERKILRGHTGGVQTIRFSEDGVHVFAAGGRSGTLPRWNTKTGKQQIVSTGTFGTSVTQLALTRDRSGDEVVVASESRTYIWNFATGGTTNVPSEVNDGVCIAISRSTDQMAIREKWGDNAVVIWDMNSKEKPSFLNSHSRSVMSLAYSPDGKILAAGDASGTITLWSLPERQSKRIENAHDATIRGLDFSPDGRFFASGGFDKKVCVWDAASGTQVAVFETGEAKINEVRFSKNGRILSVAERHHSGEQRPSIRLLDLATGATIAELPGDNSLDFSVDNKQIAIGHERQLRLWDVEWGEAAPKATATVTSLPADDNRLVTDHRPKVEPLELTIEPKDVALADGKPLSATALVQRPPRIDGLKSWTIETRDHRVPVTALAPDPAEKLLATGDSVGVIRVWQIAKSRMVRMLVGHDAKIERLVWAHDGKHLLSSDQHETRIWNAADGKLLRVLPGDSEVSPKPDWSPDGRLIAYGGEGRVWLWDAIAGKSLAILQHHEGPVRVALSPDPARMATLGEDGKIAVWDMKQVYDATDRWNDDKSFRITAGMNLVANGDFENLEFARPVGWRAETKAGKARHRSDEIGDEENVAARIDVSEKTDASWAIEVAVEPGKVYRFAGAVWTKDLDGDATIEVDGMKLATPAVSGSSDRKNYEFDVATGSRKKITIRCRVAANKGTAWFDDIALFDLDGRNLLDRPGGELAAQLDPLVEFDSPIGSLQHIAWTSDGKLIYGTSERGVTPFLDSQTGDVRQVYAAGGWAGGKNQPNLALLSPDGNAIAILANRGNLEVLDRDLNRFKSIELANSYINIHTACWIGGGKYLVTAREDGPIELTPVAGEREPRQILDQPQDLMLAVMADGNYRLSHGSEEQMVYVAHGNDARLQVFSPAAFAEKHAWKNTPPETLWPVGDPVEPPSPPKGRIVGVKPHDLVLEGHHPAKFLPDGTGFVYGDGDSLRFRNTNGHSASRVFSTNASAWDTALSPGGRMLAVTGESHSTVWDTKESSLTVSLIACKQRRWLSSAHRLTFSPDGRTLFVGAGAHWSNSGTILVVPSDRANSQFLPGKAGRMDGLVISPGERVLASLSSPRWLGERQVAVELWDSKTGKLLRELEAHGKNHGTSLAFSPDGSMLASSGADGKIRFWASSDWANFKTINDVHVGTKGAVSMAFSPDGRKLATVASRADLKLWDVETCKEIASVDCGHGEVLWVAFSPDGRMLLTSGHDGVRLWDVLYAEDDATDDKPAEEGSEPSNEAE